MSGYVLHDDRIPACLEADNLFPRDVGNEIKGRTLYSILARYPIQPYDDRDKRVYDPFRGREVDPTCITCAKYDDTPAVRLIRRGDEKVESIPRSVVTLKVISKPRSDDL